MIYKNENAPAARGQGQEDYFLLAIPFSAIHFADLSDAYKWREKRDFLNLSQVAEFIEDAITNSGITIDF